MTQRILILGAAGRDFHDFNVVFRDAPDLEVVAFTATQIPNIADRRYPAALAGPRYPAGIPIVAESELERVIAAQRVDTVVLAYSDLRHLDVMHLASRALAAGADFRLLSPAQTMLRAHRPSVAITASRTGAGKSPLSRHVASVLRDAGVRCCAIGRLRRSRGHAGATLRERGGPRCLGRAHHHRGARGVRAPRRRRHRGLRRGRLCRDPGPGRGRGRGCAQDGGNSDTPFLAPDLWITVVDPHRAGHELAYHPGEVNLRRADLVVITKVDSAAPEAVEQVRANVAAVNPRAEIVQTELRITAEDPGAITGRRVLVIEDGPSLTHGELSTGAGYLAATRLGAGEIVDPRPWAVGSIAALYRQWPRGRANSTRRRPLFPEQLAQLARDGVARAVRCGRGGAHRSICRVAGGATPVFVRVRYDIEERPGGTVTAAIERFVQAHCRGDPRRAAPRPAAAAAAATRDAAPVVQPQPRPARDTSRSPLLLPPPAPVSWHHACPPRCCRPCSCHRRSWTAPAACRRGHLALRPRR
ncbi:MAG: GTP-binding protein [Nannocystaceae bacterium]